MPKLTDEQQKERRARILDAAEICFAGSGFHRTTMQDICRAAGISAGALYLYFDSKEALIEGISNRLRDEVMQSFTKLTGSGDFLQALAMTMEDVIFGQPMHKSRLLLEIGSEGTRNEAVGATMHRCDQIIQKALTEILQRAQAEGRIAPLLPIPEIVAAMAVIGDGLFWQRAIHPDRDLRDISGALLSMMSALVRPVSTGENSEHRAAPQSVPSGVEAAE